MFVQLIQTMRKESTAQRFWANFTVNGTENFGFHEAGGPIVEEKR